MPSACDNLIERAVIIFPRFEQPDIIEHLRHRYDPVASKIGVHITVVFPFCSDITADRLRSHVKHVVSGFKPFHVILECVVGHEGEYLFLNVERGGATLIELHDQLYSGCLAEHLSPERSYAPHVTVGRLPDRVAFASALAMAGRVEASGHALVSKISCYRIERNTYTEEFSLSL